MKAITLAIVGLSMLAASAAPVAADSCVNESQYCLNDSYDLNVILRTVADVVCFDDYITCVSRRLLFG